MTAHPTVLIVGSGPTGATYARVLLEQVPPATVLMVEAGPMITSPPGMNVKNIPSADEQAAARLASQGRAGEAGVSGIPGGVVVEGTITARQGTHLIGRAAEGSPGMPAAAVATCVGGQGAHWTCATPRPAGSERITFVDEAEWDEHVATAEGLLHVNKAAFGDSPQAAAILECVREEFAADGIAVRPLPVAADPRPDGTLRWSGTDVVLCPVLDDPRFTLRPETLCVRLVRDGDRVVGAVLRDLGSGVEEEVRADAVVVAADAIRTPQLLWASGIRPAALGRYLTEHPLVFGVVAVREGLLPSQQGVATPVDPIRAVVSIGYDEERHPYHAQLMYSPVCPVPLPEDSPHRDNPAGYVGMGWGVRKWPRPEDRLFFDDEQPDENGLPSIRIAYELTEREHAELERARAHQARAAAALGEFVTGTPVLMPAGSSLHYMGTVRMGPADDGTCVCDPWSRVWGLSGLVLAGNGLIPTANSCNPTLTSVALAVRGARALAAELRDARAVGARP
ncbi:GMC family oxidoreductase N-terminal domain-containing protein [Microbispora sp. NEAU-D428]|uniref:GMC oxidoreductase n=1 Tax=Microbispora sitophila TaxID=2771537 RepID=UPI0018662038|nr:GMC oxidoreductase [Microbispora sitophila]MBE3015976.1 GMC family oxidoreductase N-terminal domain-containing protein [Microbispora sitophila]